MVPTVDRGLRLVDFWSIDTAGERPSMKSTSGLSIWPRNWRGDAESDSTYRRWPSAKIVSKASEDLPEPDRPVNTMSESRGRSSETSFRLCSRAPRMISCSVTASPAVRKAPDGRRGRVGRVSSPGRTHVRTPVGGYHGSHDLIRHRQVRRAPADPGH